MHKSYKWEIQYIQNGVKKTREVIATENMDITEAGKQVTKQMVDEGSLIAENFLELAGIKIENLVKIEEVK